MRLIYLIYVILNKPRVGEQQTNGSQLASTWSVVVQRQHCSNWDTPAFAFLCSPNAWDHKILAKRHPWGRWSDGYNETNQIDMNEKDEKDVSSCIIAKQKISCKYSPWQLAQYAPHDALAAASDYKCLHWCWWSWRFDFQVEDLISVTTQDWYSAATGNTIACADLVGKAV